jgi:protein tyrosine phosphatase (PTP) superfamily phosphohydrolase (DUF442 family)
MPNNYTRVDFCVSRSAQPDIEDFMWLRAKGVTDIFNFRTMNNPVIDFDEKAVVEALGMKYHQIPSISAKPTEENVDMFLKEVEQVKNNGGKAHIHCMAGADRTGMYAFIYKMKNGIGTLGGNIEEWILRGLHYDKYPDLAPWAINFVKRYK